MVGATIQGVVLMFVEVAVILRCNAFFIVCVFFMGARVP